MILRNKTNGSLRYIERERVTNIVICPKGKKRVVIVIIGEAKTVRRDRRDSFCEETEAKVVG